MARKYSYVNGRYVDIKHATLSINDRATLFSDGVYEGITLQDGVLIDYEPHMKRLQRSLDAVEIKNPLFPSAYYQIINEIKRRNVVQNGFVYIQVSRGVAPRNHPFPRPAVKASVVITILTGRSSPAHEYENGVDVVTHPDIRWGRRDIKSLSLLANILAKEFAIQKKAKEAWLIDEVNGVMTEGSASNAFIVRADGVIQTHPANEVILNGITRQTVLTLAREQGLTVEEKPVTLAELNAAKECFGTSSTMHVIPVTRCDAAPVGDGKVGEVTKKLMTAYENYRAEYSIKKVSA